MQIYTYSPAHAVLQARIDCTRGETKHAGCQSKSRRDHRQSSEACSFVSCTTEQCQAFPCRRHEHLPRQQVCGIPCIPLIVQGRRRFTGCLLYFADVAMQSKALEAARAALEAKRQQSPAEPRSGYFQYSSNRSDPNSFSSQVLKRFLYKPALPYGCTMHYAITEGNPLGLLKAVCMLVCPWLLVTSRQKLCAAFHVQ